MYHNHEFQRNNFVSIEKGFARKMLITFDSLTPLKLIHKNHQRHKSTLRNYKYNE